MIRTKAAVTTAELGEQFCMIGPYNEKFVHLEVEPTEPELSITREVLAQMRSHNIKVCNCLYDKMELFKLNEKLSSQLCRSCLYFIPNISTGICCATHMCCPSCDSMCSVCNSCNMGMRDLH